MNIVQISFAVAIAYLFCVTTTHQEELEYRNQTGEPHNVTEWAKSRQKRFIVFTTAGVQKFIVSLVLTIDLSDKRPWRSLAGAWNYQWQHTLPNTVLHWWNSTYFPAKARNMDGAVLPVAPLQQNLDPTATFLYAVIESYMNQKGKNGRECLQRAICENAQVNYVGGVLDHIYQRFLTPEKSMEEFYHDSYAVGGKGLDCFKIYSGCPKGDSVFDQFVYIDDV